MVFEFHLDTMSTITPFSPSPQGNDTITDLLRQLNDNSFTSSLYSCARTWKTSRSNLDLR
jgi:hypothetical protein